MSYLHKFAMNDITNGSRTEIGTMNVLSTFLTVPLGIFADIGIQGQQDAHFIVGVHIPWHQVESDQSLCQ